LSIANLGLRPLTPLRQQLTNLRPLFIGQRMSVHRKLGSHPRSQLKLSTRIRDTP
jgi:hypothetical protein